MSDTPFEVVKVTAVEAHPQATRLEVVKVLGTQFISGLGDFQVGDLCVYFPPDMLIPEKVAECLGVANYLKHSIYPGDLDKTKCRISAIRLRGVPSFGFGISTDQAEMAILHSDSVPGGFVPDEFSEGNDLTSFFSGEKYQPPERFAGGDSMRQPGAFHKYTTIQHYYRYGNAIPVGTPVRITEKIHGTNSRVGLVLDGLCCDKGDGLEFMCGTHHRRVMSENKGRASLYWTALSDNMQDMLNYISACASQEDVIVFGEIYGNKVQPMDYGCPKGKGYRVFDISVNGEYLDWCDIMTHCRLFDIETVPLLYEGPFSPDLIELSNGPTHLAGPEQIKCGFKGREGIVITPLAEQHSDELGGRLILKAVSPDYYEAMG